MLNKKSQIVIIINLLILLLVLIITLYHKNFSEGSFKLNSSLLYYYNIGVFILIYFYYIRVSRLKIFWIKFLYLFLFTIINVFIVIYQLLIILQLNGVRL